MGEPGEKHKTKRSKVSLRSGPGDSKVDSWDMTVEQKDQGLEKMGTKWKRFGETRGGKSDCWKRCP